MLSIRFDEYAPKGISEEVSNSLDLSLNLIGIYRYDGGRTLLLVQITDSGGGRVTKILAGEFKHFDCISFICSIVNYCLHSQSKALQKTV